MLDTSLLGTTGICINCADKTECSMHDDLKTWHSMEEAYSGNVPDEVYEETYIDEPDYKNGIITWCPLFSEDKDA